jgi:hypothetical protein
LATSDSVPPLPLTGCHTAVTEGEYAMASKSIMSVGLELVAGSVRNAPGLL